MDRLERASLPSEPVGSSIVRTTSTYPFHERSLDHALGARGATKLPDFVVWFLAFVWAICFLCFCYVALLAWSSGMPTLEYEVYGVGMPLILPVLLFVMTVSAGLPWARFRGDSFTASEELIFGSLFGLSFFGLILSLVVLLTG